MTKREKVIKGLEELRVVLESDQVLHPGDFVRKHDAGIIGDALALLAEPEPRVTCSVCKYGRCLSGEWFCFMLGTSRYGKRVTNGDWYCKDAIGR